MDFAFKNNKHVRLHSFLTKNACEQLFVGKTKAEILQTLTNYVKASVDFVNNYNSTHRLNDGTPIINAIDLFNELVSFDKNERGEYENIWETKYGITIEDICRVFDYAKEHKPDGEIRFLSANPDLKVKGIGTKLLNELEKREKGKEIYLFTDDKCTYQFYEHRGFDKVGEEDITLELDKKVPLKCLLYRKKL